MPASEQLNLNEVRSFWNGCGKLVFRDLNLSISWFESFARSKNSAGVFAGRGRDNFVFSKVAAIWYAAHEVKEGTLQPQPKILLWCDHDVYVHREFDERMSTFIDGHDIVYIHREILPVYARTEYKWHCDGFSFCSRADTGIISFSFSNITTYTFISCWLHAYTSLDFDLYGMHGDFDKCGFKRSPDSREDVKSLDDTYQFDLAVDSLGGRIDVGYFSMCAKFMKHRKNRAKLKLWELYRTRYKDKHFKFACPGEVKASPRLLYFYLSHLKGGQGRRFFRPLLKSSDEDNKLQVLKGKCIDETCSKH